MKDGVKVSLDGGSATRLFLFCCGSIFLSELLVMALLGTFGPPAGWNAALLDSALLMFAAFPIIYLFMFRPLQSQLARSKQSEAAVLAAQEQVDEAHRMAHIGVWEWDLAGNRVVWSRELCLITGTDPAKPAPSFKELPGFYMPDSWRKLSEAVGRALKTGEPYNLDLCVVRPDGDTRWTNAFGGARRDDQGKIIGLFGTVQDVTERRLAEAQQRASEEKFAAAFQHSPALITISSVEDGRYVTVNDEFVRVSGFSREEAVGSTSVGLGWLLPQDRARLIETLRAQGRVTGMELRLNAKDRRPVDCLYNGEFITLEGKPHLLSLALDITARKKAEETLKESEMRHRSYIEATGQIAWVTNAAGEVVEDVPSLRKFSGQTYAEARGMGWAGALHPDDIDRTLQVWQDSVKTQNPYVIEYRMRRHDGVYRDLLARGFPVFGEDGRILEWVGTCIDITERKAAEGEIRHYAETQAVLLREVNHRVKNNLAVIISMLHKEEDRAKQKGATGYLSILSDLCKRIDSLLIVHSMLSSAVWRDINISELCRNLVRRITLTGAVKVTPDISETEITVNSAQAHNLALVLNELATNSLKHAAGSAVHLKISIAISRDGNAIRMVYRDNGPGYPDLILQGDYTGTGIGFDLLTGIVRQSLRGDLSFKNENGAVAEIVFPV